MKKNLYEEIRDAVEEAIASVYGNGRFKFKSDVRITKSGEVYTTSPYTGNQHDEGAMTLYTAESWYPTRTELEGSDFCDDCVRDECGDIVDLCKSCKEAFVEDYTMNLKEWGELDMIYERAKNFIEE